MGCVIVQPDDDRSHGWIQAVADGRNLPPACPSSGWRIVSMSVNTPLYEPDYSDVHAGGGTGSGGLRDPAVWMMYQVANLQRLTSASFFVLAEVNAIADCARKGQPTAGGTIYITMPPCKNCFSMIQVLLF